MKISLTPQQYFDLDGTPLVSGRLKIFLHGSNTLANTYILTGNNFVSGPNPVVLDDAGEQQNTIFLEAAIYDVHVEKLEDGQYAKISDFQFGFVMPTAKNDTIVEGISGLADANTELGFVNVVGYDGVTYAGPRMYMWDSQCTDAADGGCIIESNNTAHGRWLLLSDLREMPCTYYGIEAGRESNMAAFLSYLPVVGTHGIFMPPVPRFVKGTYHTEGTLTTNKVLSFDQGAKFDKAFIICMGAEVTPSQTYAADFYFVNQSYAESCWFRSVHRFWKCNASELHQSPTNYFEDTNIGNYGTVGASIANKKVTGKPVTMTGAAALEFNHCLFDDKSLSSNWYTIFKNCDFSDTWFNDSNWDFGTTVSHRQLVKSSENRVVIDNFSDANAFVLQQAANGALSLDLQNRVISQISASMSFTLIRNAVIDYAHFSHVVKLENAVINHLYLENNSLALTTKGCTAMVYSAQMATWNDTGSDFSLYCDVDTTNVGINWLNTGLVMNSHRIGRSEDDLVGQKGLVMWRCTVSGGVIASSSPVMLECNIANTPVYVYPSIMMENGNVSWTMNMEFRGNRFNGSTGIFIGANNGITDHLAEVAECQVTGLAITDNVFNTVTMGVTCPFWSGASLAFRFIRGMTIYDCTDPSFRSGNLFPIPYVYKNNSGNCPKQYGAATLGSYNLPVVAEADNWSTSGQGTWIRFTGNQYITSVFVLPALQNPNKEPMPYPVIDNNIYKIDPRVVCAAYRQKAIGCDSGMCFDFPTSAYLPICAYDRSFPNDMFFCIVGAWSDLSYVYGVNPQPSGE